MDKQPVKEIWTTRDLAEAAAAGGRPVTQEYIRQLCKRGVIVASKPSRDWLMAYSTVRAWLEQWTDGDG